MPIPVVCPRCKKRMKAPDVLAGTVAKCTGCQFDVEVPEHSPEPEPEPARPGGFDREAAESLKSIDRHLSVLRTRLGCVFYLLMGWFALAALGTLLALASSAR